MPNFHVTGRFTPRIWAAGITGSSQALNVFSMCWVRQNHGVLHHFCIKTLTFTMSFLVSNAQREQQNTVFYVVFSLHIKRGPLKPPPPANQFGNNWPYFEVLSGKDWSAADVAPGWIHDDGPVMALRSFSSWRVGLKEASFFFKRKILGISTFFFWDEPEGTYHLFFFKIEMIQNP